MTGLLGQIRNIFMVEEQVVVGRRRPSRRCDQCRSWVEPEALTSAMISSQRAIQWAKTEGYGRCRAPGRSAIKNDDKKRFTKPESSCELWEGKASGVTSASAHGVNARR